MYRSALFLAAVVLFSGISAEEASKNVTSGESSKSVSPGDDGKALNPADVLDYLHPYPVDFLHKSKKYSFFCDNKVDYITAWRKCMDINQELATIESAEDNLAFLAAVGSYTDYVLTSGTDLGKEGSWMWLVNHRQIPGWNQFSAWDNGEPNNQGPEDCLVGFNRDGVLFWNDIPCGNAYCYMCQELIL
ncbi:CD209 antigen-like [Culex pipiens pallens]|nr:CD209 antigen-like [Culex pipiens pallens]